MTGDHISFVASGSYPVREGNRLRLLNDGEPAFRRICEAIEGARERVWVTVTFMWPAFVMPDGRGNALDVLGRAAARGVDVRVIFWRPGPGLESLKRNAFWGSDEHITELQSLGSRIKVRWDGANHGYCEHQKSWLIDAGSDDATAFVGGINLNPHSLVKPGHAGAPKQNHDAYVELRGPATADVHHNFVQRWNEADGHASPGGLWGEGSETQLSFPTHLPAQAGDAVAQVQRTIHACAYRDGHAAVGGRPFDIAAGERSNFDQYILALGSAQRTVYMENQYLEVPVIVEALREALERGVEVVVLLPAEPDVVGAASLSQGRLALLDARASLAAYPNFTLAGLAGLGDDGRRQPVWIHAKLMLIDDAWATVGSCNLHHYSLFGNSEMNVAFAHPPTVRAMRVELFREHLDLDTEALDDVEALRLFRSVAFENRRRFDAGDSDWRGLAFSLDVTRYGR
ncbi:MAG: phosphatidylserine/phosphatidylglycerophosphate/cardiolipin synthase family protein [Trueperaceae bacterium]|nr:phosphatidylserine/phosphatidylglycerophosphate/cardiolipin synthase family protein [Trueperaceae bacterium]